MGLFDKFKKKESEETKNGQDVKEVQSTNTQGAENANAQGADSENTQGSDVGTSEIDAAGWEAIEKEFQRVYPGQENPRHYGTLVKWSLGGNDPLDGISIYDGGDYWHFVSFGLTELYEKETDYPEYSGYGYELTFKLKKENYENEEAELKNICGIMQAIARMVFNGEVFGDDEFLYTGQTAGIDAFQKSNITGFILIKDPTVQSIDTPNGKVDFLEMVGMTDAELKTLSNVASVREIYAKLGSDVTNYHRASLI